MTLTISPSSKLLRPIVHWLKYVALLSLFINVLMLASPIYMLQIFDRVLISRSVHTLAMLTVITVSMVGVYAILDMIRTRILVRAGIALETDLGPKVLQKIHHFQYLGMPASGRAELMRDVATLRTYLSSSHLVSIFDSPWVPVFTLLIFSFSWVLGTITILGMIALFLLALSDEKLTYKHYTDANFAAQCAAQFSQASVRNAEIVQALGMQKTIVGLWRNLSSLAISSSKKAADSGSLILALTKTSRTLVQIAMLGAGAYLVIAENLPPGIMIASTIIIARAIAPIEGVISGWRLFVEARNAYANIYTLLLKDQNLPISRIALPRLKGEVVLEDVAIYSGPDHPLLRSVSIKLAPGESLGVIGASGSGKSTLIRAILGLLKPAHGRVVLDGYDVGHYERLDLGDQIGYVPQEPALLAGSIGQNICRMRGAQANAVEIVRVSEWINLTPIIARLKNGYAELLTEDGQNLSSGQRQLISLARAFFGNPAIVVMDEPDSHLDQASQEHLLTLIDEIREKRSSTLIIASHNPRIIDRMDRLLVLRDGATTQLAKKSKTQSAIHPTKKGDQIEGQAA